MNTTSFEEYADILNRILTRIYPDTVCLPDEEVERMLQAALDETEFPLYGNSDLLDWIEREYLDPVIEQNRRFLRDKKKEAFNTKSAEGTNRLLEACKRVFRRWKRNFVLVKDGTTNV